MSLVERGSRFSFYIMFILALPVLLETDFILQLWLKQYPDHTVNFVRLVLLLSLSDILSNTLITLQNANGNIRNYQIAVGGMLLMNFPLSYCCLKAGFLPESTLVVALFVSVCCLILRLLFCAAWFICPSGDTFGMYVLTRSRWLWPLPVCPYCSAGKWKTVGFVFLLCAWQVCVAPESLPIL